jgi:hypothetical protein
MKLRMLRFNKVNELRSNIEDNLDLYRYGNFNYITTDYSNYFECDIEILEGLFAALIPNNENLSEVSNSKLMLKAMGDLSPYIAKDERLWVYLTHSYLLDYARIRWGIPEDNEKAVKHIATHFFARSGRGFERDNAASRLWWLATLCRRVEDLDLDHSLQCLLHDSDVRASIIERPTTSQCMNVFSALIKKLHESYIGEKKLYNRDLFRPLMKKINIYGGIKLLNAMEEADILKLIDDAICTPA